MAVSGTAGARQVAPSRLWFGLAASAFAWASLGIVDILITWQACMGTGQEQLPGAHPGARVAYAAVTLLLLGVVVAAGTTSYRNWKVLTGRSRSGESSIQNRPGIQNNDNGIQLLESSATDRREFMALLGVFVSVTLGMGVLWLSLPPLFIELCARVR